MKNRNERVMKKSDDVKLICEACRSEFSCSASSGSCWCFDVEVDSRALLEIEEKYGNCLCPACLPEISSQFAAERFTASNDSL